MCTSKKAKRLISDRDLEDDSVKINPLREIETQAECLYFVDLEILKAILHIGLFVSTMSQPVTYKAAVYARTATTHSIKRVKETNTNNWSKGKVIVCPKPIH